MRQGMGWSGEDLDRKQILVETSFGDSHPGSVHLDRLSRMAEDGLKYAGAKPSRFTVTDICDGIAQGHEGMNYSLLSRDLMAGMIEIHCRANAFDGMVCAASCDKSVPAHLMAMARMKLPSIFVPGGVMERAAAGLTLEQIGTMSADFRRGQLSEGEMKRYQIDACTSCGACQFMGTAGTMQAMAEALGLSLPWSALVPANTNYADRLARSAGQQAAVLAERGITSADILTENAFRNAAAVHSALGGSTNALLHLPAVAREVGISFRAEEFDAVHRRVPFMVNTRPAGQYSTDLFWYAGGVPRLMMEIRDHLCLDTLTVTGKTLGENLEDLRCSGYMEYMEGYLDNFGLKRGDLIRRIADHGAVAVLKGNIAEKGAVIKCTGISESMLCFKGRAKVFAEERQAREAILEGRIKPGDVIVIPFAGPQGRGMPEMFYTTEALCSDRILSDSTAIVTDGRFSGAGRGPCVGHVSPEAAEGGNIGLLRDGDLIVIDIANRRLDAPDIDFLLRKKEAARQSDFLKQETEILGCGSVLTLYRRNAVCAMDGGYMR
ncbi:dihydroxy-acid dehydratase [Bacilliculturomica massiliensis]|uniref:dihydroxy-acid dehydratase n=1 Tax=Bacilliculturomica massiliensis TaxID=1917867 RepID=UPI002ED67288